MPLFVICSQLGRLCQKSQRLYSRRESKTQSSEPTERAQSSWTRRSSWRPEEISSSVPRSMCASTRRPSKMESVSAVWPARPRTFTFQLCQSSPLSSVSEGELFDADLLTFLAASGSLYCFYFPFQFFYILRECDTWFSDIFYKLIRSYMILYYRFT